MITKIKSLVCIALSAAGVAKAQSWQYVGSATNPVSGNSASNSSIAIDGNGTPYVAFTDYYVSQKATVMKYNGTAWVTVGAADFSPGSANNLSIAIDSSNTPYVAYTDGGNSNKVTVMKLIGSTWTAVGGTGISNSQSAYTSLVIDGSGVPYVAYRDGSGSYKAIVKKYNGTNWVTVGTNDISPGQANYPSLAFDANGNLYIGYVDVAVSSETTVMKYNTITGGAWSVVGTADFSAASAAYTSIAVDGIGTPYIAYSDGTNSSKATVMKYNGTSWVALGASGVSAAAAYWTNIVTDKTGTPYIVYEDVYNSYKVTVKKYGGTSWITVGTEGFSGGSSGYTNLAIKNGIAYVAYITTTGNDGCYVEKYTSLYPSWTGATSTDWNTASNWSTGIVPASTDGISIPGGITNMPTLSAGTYNIGSLQQDANTTFTLAAGSVLNMTGNLMANGTINGAGFLALNGTTTTITGNGTINRLIRSNTGGAVITAGSNIKITGNYYSTSPDTLTTNGGLTLVSNASGTGRIGLSSGFISGIVNVQQYIPGGRRAYRFFSHPFSASIPLSQLETTIDITGTGGSSNGFTPTSTNNPSAFWYNTAGGNGSVTNDTGWKAFTSANGSGNNAWNAFEGIRLLVRGSQGQGLNGNAYTPAAATVTMKGNVNQGNISVPFTVGANSHYNVLGNPYPSSTNIGGVIYNAKQAGAISGSAYYVWDANQQTQGAYVTLPIDSTVYNLPMNAAFVINAATSGGLSFTEANKVSAVTALFKATADNKYTKLTINDNTGDTWDALYVSFNPNASATSEDNDADKMHNTALDFYSLSSDKEELSIDARPYANGLVIPLGLQTSIQQVYSIKADAVNVPNGAQLMLHDKYLNQYQTLTLGSEYTFAVTADTVSQGNNRFELSMVGNTTNIAAVSSGILQVSIAPNPASDKAVVTYTGANDNVRVSVTDVMGRVVYTISSANNNGTISLPVQGLAAGYYMVVTQCGDQKIVNKLVKE